MLVIIVGLALAALVATAPEWFVRRSKLGDEVLTRYATAVVVLPAWRTADGSVRVLWVLSALVRPCALGTADLARPWSGIGHVAVGMS